MKPTIIPLLSALLLLLSGCYNYGIYQHPMHLNTQLYHAKPMKEDSSKSALYAAGSAIIGFANQRWRDEINALQGSIHMGHRFGSFQAHYGLNGSIGRYRASDYIFPEVYPASSNNLDEALLDSINGNKFFGSAGFSAGINCVIPFDNGGEWRAIGLEFNHQYEWDNSYFSFRDKIPLDAANLVEQGRNYTAISVSSEILFKSGKEYFGYKVAIGAATQKPPFFWDYANRKYPVRTHISQTFLFSSGRAGWYGQANIGYYGGSAVIGLNYRLR